ncbi:serine hydrolase domain-containing protein [Nonomuraea typhae]|uniref:serine hydrolase domain-containing protein n=1 Tax=Nonomuraea typhae TaxID=2603600 RepID=UPI0012F8E038|nr:serine hydrolase domain-containing protein [Nonomuraea typhae]
MMTNLLIAALVMTPTPATPAAESKVQAMLDTLVRDDKATAALIRVDSRAGGWSAAAGVADLRTKKPADPAGHFRIGSITKTFAATVVMQLVDEGKVKLDEPIARYLPGEVPGGAKITVRRILDHTSGLYDYMHEPGYSTNRWRGKDRFRHYDPAELLKVAFADPAKSTEPGKAWAYSNTNYVVAGRLIEKVTGRPYGKEVERRLLRPLKLTGTSVPGDRPGLPYPHARGYEPVGGKLVDATRMNPSLDGAAGEMISTGSDLNRFAGALLGGKLTSARSLAAMRTTQETQAGFRYGLGLQQYPLPCGKSVWGHSGELIGYLTFTFATEDGTRMTLSVNPGTRQGTTEDLFGIAATIFC